MATDKFLKRIVAPDIEGDDNKMARNVHAFTHGINSSDPLLLIGILFSALIHDAGKIYLPCVSFLSLTTVVSC